jgi:hypothetical protein
MDLGAWPNGSVTAITQRDYRVDDKDSAAKISEGAMCNRGGTFYYEQTGGLGYQHDQHPGWNQVNVPRGMMVSATALSSFAGSIHFTEV